MRDVLNDVEKNIERLPEDLKRKFSKREQNEFLILFCDICKAFADGVSYELQTKVRQDIDLFANSYSVGKGTGIILASVLSGKARQVFKEFCYSWGKVQTKFADCMDLRARDSRNYFLMNGFAEKETDEKMDKLIKNIYSDNPHPTCQQTFSKVVVWFLVTIGENIPGANFPMI